MSKDQEGKDWPWVVFLLVITVICIFVIEFLKTV